MSRTSATTTPGPGARRGRGTRADAGAAGSQRPPGLPWILPALVLVRRAHLLLHRLHRLHLDPGLGRHQPRSRRTSGAANYTRIFPDPVFWAAIRHTVVFFVVTFVVQTVLGLAFAVLLHSRVRLAVSTR